jgi:hypothetical protein
MSQAGDLIFLFVFRISKDLVTGIAVVRGMELQKEKQKEGRIEGSSESKATKTERRGRARRRED